MDPDLPAVLAVGFLAQLIDGSLGMAYGVSSTSFLLAIGVPPAAASASVHAAEILTSGVSGLSHYHFGNVSKPLFRRLAVPGVLGGIVGAYLLASFPGQRLKPYVAAYLLGMGILIIWKALGRTPERDVTTHIGKLGLAGGFFDAVGGGGWGPIVTSTLVARGHNPRITIGSVNLAEFFVTLAQSLTFLLTIGFSHWTIIAGLILGGVVAAPLAAYASRRIPTRTLMGIVGCLIVFLSLRTILSALG